MGPAALDLITAAWRKSSYSSGDQDNCVEVADGVPSLVPVRDSKDPAGPALAFPAASFAAFLTALKADSLS
ncbi:DUF397 domain-containing protein [Kitasatospora sp. LaBMicrA B282]|uniref:DUF397 domain-containing protein n=1 Tax=Kitasatospora sp. LaBMicrA B282 TaxID=3420949 RepID=UPI003D0A4912